MLNPHPHPLTLLLRRPILLLDSLLEFTVGPVEQDLCALAGYQQTLHLAHRHTPVLLHCGILFIPQSLCWEEEKKKRKKIKAMVQNKQWSSIHSCGLSTLHIADCTQQTHRSLWSAVQRCERQSNFSVYFSILLINPDSCQNKAE